MNHERLNQAIQIITGIALIIGIGLVIWELRQGRDVAVAQLHSEQFAMLADRLSSAAGENAAEVLAKACYAPDDISREEQQILAAYFNAQWLVVARMLSISGRTCFYNDSLWELWASPYFSQLFETRYGRYYFDRYMEETLSSRSKEIAKSARASYPDDYDCSAGRFSGYYERSTHPTD